MLTRELILLQRHIMSTLRRRSSSVDLYKNRLTLLVLFHGVDADVVKQTGAKVNQGHGRLWLWEGQLCAAAFHWWCVDHTVACRHKYTVIHTARRRKRIYISNKYKINGLLPVIGAWGLDQLIWIEVSPTSLTTCLVGASGAAQRMRGSFFQTHLVTMSVTSRQWRRELLLPVVCEVVRMRLGCPRLGTSKTLTLYLRPGRRLPMVTEVDVRGTSGKQSKVRTLYNKNWIDLQEIWRHYGGFRDGQRLSPRTLGWDPSSLSSYSTLKPEMVVSADVQDTTKLFEVISVTDSEVSNTGGGAVVSPSYVSTFEIKEHGVILNISLDVLLWCSHVAVQHTHRSQG